MKVVTVAGPFTKEAAEETAKALGLQNHSIYSQYKNDPEGFVTDEKEWFVERDQDAMPARIFGRSWEEIQDMQMKRK